MGGAPYYRVHPGREDKLCIAMDWEKQIDPQGAHLWDQSRSKAASMNIFLPMYGLISGGQCQHSNFFGILLFKTRAEKTRISTKEIGMGLISGTNHGLHLVCINIYFCLQLLVSLNFVLIHGFKKESELWVQSVCIYLYLDFCHFGSILAHFWFQKSLSSYPFLGVIKVYVWFGVHKYILTFVI